jgi:hypothetical protein
VIKNIPKGIFYLIAADEGISDFLFEGISVFSSEAVSAFPAGGVVAALVFSA